MATYEMYQDLDLLKVNQLINARKHNVDDTEMATLAGTLDATNEGLLVWNTDQKKDFTWDGTAFVDDRAEVPGAMVYRGTVSSLTTVPAPADGNRVGDTYVFTGTAGTLTWAGQTFFPNATIEPNDQIIYRGSDIWDIFEGDDDEASETVFGNVKLATQAEVNAGVQATHAVTPATLAAALLTNAYPRIYFLSDMDTTANTDFVVTHNLNLQHKDAFVISVKNSAGKEVNVNVTSTTVNTMTIRTSPGLTNATVTIIGR